ncbi:MAG: hypothetical protein ABIO70_09990 [Pseudomonadota bacterium]
MPRTNDKLARHDERPTLSFLETAREHYGAAFGRRRPGSVERARDDWADLAEEDRSFALGHLLYLNLMAESATVRLLVQVRDLLDEVAEGLAVDEDDDGEEPEELDEEPGFEPQAPPVALAEAVGGQAEEVEGEILDGEDDDDDGEPDDDDGDGRAA